MDRELIFFLNLSKYTEMIAHLKKYGSVLTLAAKDNVPESTIFSIRNKKI